MLSVLLLLAAGTSAVPVSNFVQRGCRDRGCWTRVVGRGGGDDVAASCTPTTCLAQSKNCGSLSDGCGNTLNCGSCTSPQYCSSNVCTDPQLSFATASAVGMTAECACTDVTTAQAGAVSFTRASAGFCTTGNVNQPTSMTSCTNNKPRVMHGGTGAGNLGLLMELSSTNNTLRSQEFDSALVWVPGSTVAATPTVTADFGAAPDGTTTADRIQIPVVGGGQNSYLLQIGACTSSDPTTLSVYLKGNGQSGTLEISGTASSIVDTCAYADGVWSRCILPIPVSGGAAIYFFLGTASARGAQDFLAWGAQCESKSSASSYIPTAGSAVVRAVDVATTPYTAAGGTMSMSADVVWPPVLPVLNATAVSFTIDANNRTRITASAAGASAALSFITTIASSANTTNSAATFAGGSTTSIAGYYDGVNKGSCVGGVCTQSAQSLTLITGAGLVYLGNSGTANLQVQGVVKNVCVDPTHCPSYGL